jgi:hypothetical protein
MSIIIYTNSQSRVFLVFYSVESISRESDEIRLSPSQQRDVIDRRITKKKSRAPSREDATLGHASLLWL